MNQPILGILWIALLLSQVIYLVVAFIVPGEPMSTDTGLITWMLGIVSVVIAVSTLILRRRALVAPIQAGQIDPSTPEGYGKIFVPFLLNLVLTESIAINGFVIALLSREPERALPFAIGAFALMIYHRPTAPDLSPPATAGTYRPPAL